MPTRAISVLAAAAALLEIGTHAWIPLSSTARQRRMTIAHAYLDDGSSPVNGNNSQKSLLPPQAPPEVDFTGAGTLGDIMSKQSAESGLVTTDGGLLHKKFGIESPLDRMALTGRHCVHVSDAALCRLASSASHSHLAHPFISYLPTYIANGNLQRLFSSYYDAPVHVVVDTCDQTTEKTWNRIVHLTVHGQTFCTAKSRITVHDKECCILVESGTVGLGQLFRHLDKLPSFSLLEAGYCELGGLWRVYELDCAELTCHIEETFLPEMWSIEP